MMLITTLVVSFLVCCMLEVRCGQAGVVSGLQSGHYSSLTAIVEQFSSTLSFPFYRRASQNNVPSLTCTFHFHLYVCVVCIYLFIYLYLYILALYVSSSRLLLFVTKHNSSSDGTTPHAVCSSAPGHSRLFCLSLFGSLFSVLASLYLSLLYFSIYFLSVIWFLFLCCSDL